MREEGTCLKDVVKQYYGDIYLSDEEDQIVDKLLQTIKESDFKDECQRIATDQNRNRWRFGRIYVNKVAVVAIVISLLLVSSSYIVITSYIKSTKTIDRNINHEGTLPGTSEIYPTVMVDGRLYEWRRGRAIGGRPKDSVYYGEINHVDGKKPTENCDFVSVFSVSGQIYTVPGITDCVYLCLTTDWMENKNVTFDLVE